MTYLCKSLAPILSALILSLCLTAFLSANAQGLAEEVDRFLLEHLETQSVPGAAVILFDGGEITFSKSYGRANHAEDVSLDTVFALGSISKSFTALVILQMEAEGALALNQTLDQFPPFSDYRSAATIQQLLTHTSGYSNKTGNRNIAERSTSDEALRSAAIQLSRAPKRQAGDFAYSNTNYQLLGALIEYIDGVPYEEAISNRVLIPLGMNSSFVRVPKNEGASVASGYRFWGPKAIKGAPAPGRVVTPQSGVYASANDMMIYLTALIEGDERIFPNSSTASLRDFSDQGTYGAGWFLSDPHAEDSWLYHGGMNAGFKAEVGFQVGSSKGFVILTNASDGFAHGDAIGVTEGVRDIMLVRPVRTPGFPARNWLTLLGLATTLLTLAWLLGLRLRCLLSGEPLKQSRSMIAATSLVASLGIVIGFGIESLVGVPLSGILLFKPDIGYGLAALIGLCAALVAAHIMLLLKLYWIGGFK